MLAGGIAGKSCARRLQSVPELAIGAWQAWRLLTRLRPAAVVGFGGYPALPTMIAACRAGLCRSRRCPQKHTDHEEQHTFTPARTP